MRIRTALVTSRSAPAHDRAIRTLMSWDIEVDEAMFLGGLEKGPFLQVFAPDFFFDDQMTHLSSAAHGGRRRRRSRGCGHRERRHSDRAGPDTCIGRVGRGRALRRRHGQQAHPLAPDRTRLTAGLWNYYCDNRKGAKTQR